MTSPTVSVTGLLIFQLTVSPFLIPNSGKIGIHLIGKPRKTMKNKLMPLMDKILTRKRAIVETIIDQLKNISQIEHSRHRSPINFLVKGGCGLIAYCHQPKKPALSLDEYLLPEA